LLAAVKTARSKRPVSADDAGDETKRAFDDQSGNGAWPVVESTQLGRRSVAPLVPQFEQRVLRRSTSLVISSP
jgi:hypothetical protein